MRIQYTTVIPQSTLQDGWMDRCVSSSGWTNSPLSLYLLEYETYVGCPFAATTNIFVSIWNLANCKNFILNIWFSHLDEGSFIKGFLISCFGMSFA